MKKLFYIFASAIVALGAVACQNEIEEGINANNESLSFTANIDEATRVAFDEDGKTIWAAGDEIEVIFGEKTFVFTNTEDDVNTFTCTETGVTSIVGQEIEAIYSYENGRTIESSKGIAGSHLVAEGVFPEAEQGSALIFRLQNALLYFFANTEVTFNSSEDIFAVEGVASNELTISASEEMQYVAIKGATTDFSYSVGEKVIKELAAFSFEAGKKYNLGNLNGEKNIAEGVVENLEGEYIISSEAGLFWLAATVEEGNNLVDKTVKLGDDITLTQPWTPIGNKGAGKYNDGYAYSFAGTFDGQGYAIKNMVVENDGVTGFFGYKWYGDIKNVKFENAIVKGDHYAGVVVGWTDGAQRGTRWLIDNCDVTGSTITIAVKNNDNGDKAGAITGYAYGVTIQNCDIDNTTITGYRDLGAIAGAATSNTDEGNRNAIVKENTLGENIEIVVDNTINYNNYKIQSDYNVGVYVGRILRNAVVEDNTGDATITWGEIAAEQSAVEKLNEQIAAGETEITISESFEMTAEDPKITIAEGQDVTITLAEGVEITGEFSDSSYDSLFDIRKGGTLTIGGEGSIALISVKGNVNNYGQYIFENNGGTLNIVGGTYNMEVTGNGSATWYIPALLNNNSTTGETTTNISGGRFYSETCINIMRQFINNQTYNATINITGGEFEGTGTKTYGIWNQNSGGSGLGYINISGDVQMNNVYVENDAPKANAVVSGGTFGYQPGTAASSYNAVTIAEGYVTVKDGETYTVATLQDALTAGASHIILPEGTYDFGNLTNFPASVTFEGVSKENTIVNMNKSIYLQDKIVNFKNLSYTAPANLTYNEGAFAFIHHAAEFNFDNCIINRLRLNVVKSTIKDSTFEVVTSSGFDGYGLYYYGRSNGTDSEVLVDNCEFNSKQKAICIYNEGPVSGFNLTVNNTTFTASETTDKTAISIHTEKGITGNLTINSSSATGFYDVNDGLWRVFNNETKVDTENFTVIVDGEKVWPVEIPTAATVDGVEYTEIADALEAAASSESKTVKVVAGTYDALSNVPDGVTIEGAEGTVFEGASSIGGENVTIKNITFTNTTSASGTEYRALTGNLNGDVTFENCHFDSKHGARYCYANGDIVFNNCTFGNEDCIRGVHFDAGEGTVTFNECAIYGFTAMGSSLAKVTFNDCEFPYNNNYNVVNMYSVFEYTDCKFNPSMFTDCAGNGVTATYTNCVYTDSKDISTIVRFDKDPATCTITINGKTLIADGVMLNAEGEYEISNAAGLVWFEKQVNESKNNFSGKTVKLVEDITLTEAWTPVGQTGATQFTGSFDGQDHTIYGLTINAPASYDSNDAAGFFGWLESYSGSVIKNIKFDGATIAGYHYVGTVAGYVSGGTEISGCEVTNSTIAALSTVMTSDTNEYRGDKVGGIVGYTNSNNKINNNKVSKTQITGYRQIGGIAGYLYASATGNSIEEVTINVCNDQNTENFTVRNQYGVNSLFGVTAGTATNNTGEATINWGEIPAAKAMVGSTYYATVEAAITAANGAVVTLLADATVSQACVINAKGFALTAGDGYLALKNYANNNGYYDVVAATKSTSWTLAGDNGSGWNNAMADFYQITGAVDGTSTRKIYVAHNVTLTATSYWKACYNNWKGWCGAAGTDDNTPVNPSDKFTKANKYSTYHTYDDHKDNFNGLTGTYDIYMAIEDNFYTTAYMWGEKLN